MRAMRGRAEGLWEPNVRRKTSVESWRVTWQRGGVLSAEKTKHAEAQGHRCPVWGRRAQEFGVRFESLGRRGGGARRLVPTAGLGLPHSVRLWRVVRAAQLIRVCGEGWLPGWWPVRQQAEMPNGRQCDSGELWAGLCPRRWREGVESGDGWEVREHSAQWGWREKAESPSLSGPPVLRQVSWKREVSELKMACGDGTGGSEGLPPPSSGPKILPGGCELPPPLSSSHALLGSSSAAPEAICNCLLYLFLTFSKSVLFSHGCCVKWPQTSWLKTIEICSLSAPETGSPGAKPEIQERSCSCLLGPWWLLAFLGWGGIMPLLSLWSQNTSPPELSILLPLPLL